MPTCTKCPATLGNTAKPNCIALLDVTKSGFLTNTYASDGTRNCIPAGTVINEAFIIGKINEPDPTKRWYPLLKLSMVTDERADSETEDIDGVAVVTDDGVRTFTAYTPKASYVYLEKLKRGRCASLSIFLVDAQSTLSGSTTDPDYFYPFQIEDGTFDPSLVKPQKGVSQKVKLKFDFSTLEKDEHIHQYSSDTDLLKYASSGGLLDLFGEILIPSTTGFSVRVTHEYGTFNKPALFVGLKIADFVLENLTTGLPVIVTSVTEQTDGEYDFVTPAQTAGDKMRLRTVKNGIVLIEEFTIA